MFDVYKVLNSIWVSFCCVKTNVPKEMKDKIYKDILSFHQNEHNGYLNSRPPLKVIENMYAKKYFRLKGIDIKWKSPEGQIIRMMRDKRLNDNAYSRERIKLLFEDRFPY